MNRPFPLRDAARIWAMALGASSGVISALVTAGVLSADQGAAVGNAFTGLDLLVSAVVGVVAASSAALGAFGVAHSGEPKVTPVADPRDVDGARLVRDPGADPTIGDLA